MPLNEVCQVERRLVLKLLQESFSLALGDLTLGLQLAPLRFFLWFLYLMFHQNAAAGGRADLTSRPAVEVGVLLSHQMQMLDSLALSCTTWLRFLFVWPTFAVKACTWLLPSHLDFPWWKRQPRYLINLDHLQLHSIRIRWLFVVAVSVVTTISVLIGTSSYLPLSWPTGCLFPVLLVVEVGRLWKILHGHLEWVSSPSTTAAVISGSHSVFPLCQLLCFVLSLAS